MYLEKLIEDIGRYWHLLIMSHVAVFGFTLYIVPGPNSRVAKPTPIPDTYYYKYTIGSEPTGYSGIPDSLAPKYVATVDRLLNSRSIQGMKTCRDLGEYVSNVQRNTKDMYERRLKEVFLYRIEIQKSSDGKEVEKSTTKVEKYSSEELVILDSLKKYYLRGQ